MHATDFKTQGAAMYGGYGWMSRLAEALGVNVSTVHRYANGRPIPRHIALAMDALRAARVREIEVSPSAPAADPTSGERAAGDRPSPFPVARHGDAA